MHPIVYVMQDPAMSKIIETHTRLDREGVPDRCPICRDSLTADEREHGGRACLACAASMDAELAAGPEGPPPEPEDHRGL